MAKQTKKAKVLAQLDREELHGVDAAIALLLFVTTLALVAMIINVEGKQRAPQPAE